MRPLRANVLIMILSLTVIGCGGSHMKAKGHVMKGGQPFLLPEGEGLRIFFAPVDPAKSDHFDSFAAEYDPSNGSFQVQGKDGKGLPPGKYRVDIQLMKSKEDLLGGKLMGKKSPFVLEVTSSGGDLLIDLDASKFDELLAAEQSKPVKKRKG
jgi:hypothetical protein